MDKIQWLIRERRELGRESRFPRLEQKFANSKQKAATLKPEAENELYINRLPFTGFTRLQKKDLQKGIFPMVREFARDPEIEISMEKRIIWGST